MKNKPPVEERAVIADNLGPIFRQIVLFLVMPQTIFPGRCELASGALVVLQSSSFFNNPTKVFSNLKRIPVIKLDEEYACVSSRTV